MNLNPQQHTELRKLLKLADISQEFEFIDLKLVNHFSNLREEHGLAKLLLMLEQHVKNPPSVETSAPSDANKD